MAKKPLAKPSDAKSARKAEGQSSISIAKARAFMEMAVEEMGRSVAEVRNDRKASPKVGAVLVTSDGRVFKAHRGELRDGDHAEFTLLERKMRAERLDGALLFATLEPCAPDARKPPKLGCAERIVLARIRKVWVGIEDPDPMVDRKGIKYIQTKGIDVEMFDRDLQEQIRTANKEFLAQALERAAAAQSERVDVSLSTLEHSSHANWPDLSESAIQQFATSAKLDAKSSDFKRRLAQMGLLDKSVSSVPTGFGLLLFGKEPRVAYQNAGLLATIEYPDSHDNEIKDFDGPAVLVPGQVLEWLRAKLPSTIRRTEARRRETDEGLFEMLREAIVNALVHRDYDIAEAKCQLLVTPDVIEIRSPGKPIEPLTLEQLQSFNAPMLSRNPVLHYVFARMELAEERGLGLRSIRRQAQEMRLPLPTYTWEAPYLVLRIFRTSHAAVAILPDSVSREFSAGEKGGWEWFCSRGITKSPEYAKAQGIAERVARRHLNHFVDLNLARKRGAGPSTVYEVLA